MRRRTTFLFFSYLILSVLAVGQLSAGIQSVEAISLTVNDLKREVDFFTKVLQFEKVSTTISTESELDDLLDLDKTKVETVELRLGTERLLLAEHLKNKGRSIPLDSRSYDHWFQHIAIVVSDIDKAYQHFRANKVKHVSTSPQTLPEWNKDAGGIKAFYFRDPEDHVLEIIWFPPGKGDPKWQTPTDQLFLGIDHTAIVVSDTDRSLAFYQDTLGMKVVGGAENYGVEQEHLNQVFGARLRITALRAPKGPGIEFLEYITPPGGRPIPQDAKANDLIFWRTHLGTDRFDTVMAALRDSRAQFVSRSHSKSNFTKSPFIVRDPDGHALQIESANSERLFAR